MVRYYPFTDSNYTFCEVRKNGKVECDYRGGYGAGAGKGKKRKTHAAAYTARGGKGKVAKINPPASLLRLRPHVVKTDKMQVFHLNKP